MLLNSFFFLLSALVTAGGQLLLKRASSILGQTLQADKTSTGILGLVKKVFIILTEPHIMVALVLYVSGLFLWIKVLSRANLSQAYPALISITIILTTIGSVLFFKESFSLEKAGGIVLLVIGFFLITH